MKNASTKYSSTKYPVPEYPFTEYTGTEYAEKKCATLIGAKLKPTILAALTVAAITIVTIAVFTISARPAWCAEPEPPKRTLVWDVAELNKVPPIHETKECPAPGMRAFFYEGLEFKARPTHVFAYYSAPEGTPPKGGWPAVVCAHGGGGTAYPDWVKKWNEHGYAAISMDLEGHLPDKRWHENAGPSRVMAFMDIGLADREQWFYHAVADVIRANSLLRSFPEINPDKIGLTGISWGGTIVCTAAGVDSRWAFVIPVYGCGFLPDTDNEGVNQWFRVMGGELLADYRAKWDPAAHLPYAKMPMLWMNGTNDGTFPMDIFQRSALAAAGPRTLCIRLRWLHGHEPGWRQKETYAFADSVVNGGPPLLKFERPELDADTGTARCKVTGKIASASLNYTTDTGAWKTRWWENAGCEVKPDELSGKLPKGAKFFFFNARDERGCLGSSEFIEVKAK